MKVLGIDLGTRKAALSLFIDTELFLARDFESRESSPRQQQLRYLAQVVYDFCDNYEPDWVWIEGIIVGNNRKYSLALAEVKGAILSELALLEEKQLFGIDWVDNTRWKKEIIGSGNATKEEIQNWVKENHPPYAVLCGEDQDKYDATCIGLYGVRIVERSESLRLEEH